MINIVQKHRFLLTLFVMQLMASPLWAAQSKSVSIQRVEAESTKKEIKLCALTDEYIDNDQEALAKTFVELNPKQPFDIDINYRSICLTGLKPRTEYKFVINKNIPLGEDRYLDKSYQLSGVTGDYDPSVRFVDNGYILPSQGDITIPVETINVSEIEVSLSRINDRNMIHSINKYGLIQSLSSYRSEEIRDTDGYFLWKKHLNVQLKQNQKQVTAIPVGEFLKTHKPGVYILTTNIVKEEGTSEYEYNTATQWFMLSDIGLYTLTGSDGLHIFTKALSSAKPYQNVKLELIAENNEKISQTTTKDGHAFFAANLLTGKGGLRAKAIYAYGKDNDFSILDLSRAEHDLSDRGVQGRASLGKYDAFVYSNRGIFRPGEVVPFHTLVRNVSGQSQADFKVVVQVLNSKQSEVYSNTFSTDDVGHLADSFVVDASAPTGKWQINILAGDKTPIGSLSFLVEDFVPPKIKIDIKNKPPQMIPEQETTIQAQVAFLNGSPAKKAAVEVSILLRQAKKPFTEYKSYFFGDITKSYKSNILSTQALETDVEGMVEIPILLEKLSSPRPVSARIAITASEPGGRPVESVINTLVVDRPAYIGIKPHFEAENIAVNSSPSFSVVVLKDKKLINEKLSYTLVKEKVDWHWQFVKSDDWEYYRTYRDLSNTVTGTLASSETKPVTLQLGNLDWGDYRLEVRNGNQDILSSYRFSSGYSEDVNQPLPDRLPVAVDKESYQLGDQVKVNIHAKFTGPVLVSIAHHDIVETKTVQAEAGQDKEVTFKVKNTWGASAYVLATAFRAAGKKLGANRAIGLAHIKITDPKQNISLFLDYPKQVKSSESTDITLVAKQLAGLKTYITLAAVDEGVLRLTHYAAPNPQKYFFGQRALGIKIRDIYGNLIDTIGAHAKFNVGSDDDEEAGDVGDETVVGNKRKVVALFSQVVQFDAKGKANVALDIPDYQGSLRLMAVAWNQKAVGSATGEMIIKDSISPEIYLPRFISVGDEAKTLLTTDFDTTVPAGKYTLEIKTEGGVTFKQQTFTFDFSGKKPESFSTDLMMHAGTYQDGVITLLVKHKNKTVMQRQWEIGVRTASSQVYVRKLGLINAKQSFDLSKEVDESHWLDERNIQLKISGQPLLPTQSISNELLDYMGRCAEQTTSRAMPWLFTAKTDMSESLVRKAINRLLTYQKLSGGFGLWKSSRTEVWVTAYVLDFLIRTKKAGYSVSSSRINSGLSWLENNVSRWHEEDSKGADADAYALYVLTLSGETLMSDMKHMATSPDSTVSSPAAFAHLGSAFAWVGEKALAKKMFKKANESLIKNPDYYANYGGALRDEAAMITLMKESDLGLDWQNAYANLVLSVDDKEYLSTQEMSTLLRLAYQTDIKKNKLTLSLEGKPVVLGKGEYVSEVKRFSQVDPVFNQGESKVWYDFSFKATPDKLQRKEIKDNGFTIQKTIYTLEGEEIDINDIRQNQRLVVVLTGVLNQNKIENPLITDWLPAGFEIENPHLAEIDIVANLDWLREQGRSPVHNAAYRNDRFEAALDMGKMEGKDFEVAYIVRAVTLGKFMLAPAKIEDMYQPRFRAFSVSVSQPVVIGDKQEIVPNLKKEKPSLVSELSEKDYLAVYSQPIVKLQQYKIEQLLFLRNAIFAQAGLDFEKTNPMLYKEFSEFSWYKPGAVPSGEIYKQLSAQQKENVQRLLTEEKTRLGGLTLGDIYRVKSKVLGESDISKYTLPQLKILRNSLFARYGLAFDKTAPELDKIFSYISWYKPTDSTGADIFDNRMTPQEQANVNLIGKREKVLEHMQGR